MADEFQNDKLINEKFKDIFYSIMIGSYCIGDKLINEKKRERSTFCDISCELEYEVDYNNIIYSIQVTLVRNSMFDVYMYSEVEEMTKNVFRHIFKDVQFTERKANSQIHSRYNLSSKNNLYSICVKGWSSIRLFDSELWRKDQDYKKTQTESNVEKYATSLIRK